MPHSHTSDHEALAREGSVLDEKWTLVRLVGIGGMGAVYAARHRNGARAAVKILHPEYSRHEQVRERFRREGYAANKVDHPGVVRVLDDDVVASGPDAGTVYLVMELLEGQSLQDRLESGGSFGEKDFLELADGVLDVLRAAHEAGVVHRDLKPENLFFEESDGRARIKLLDFGMARILDQQAITSYGMALGTPSFMAPEQAAGRLDEIDGRTDLFALAATGFRLRTGRRIHEADDVVELVKRMGTTPAPPIRSVAAEVSVPFARVIDRALQFKPADRHADAAAMQADVRRALAELAELPARPQARPKASPSPILELSSRDLEPAPVYGLDDSIRIPKRRSVLPWLVLLACVAGGVAYARTHDLGALFAPTSSAPAASTAMDAATSGLPVVDAGLGRPHGRGKHRPVPPAPATSP